jgi:probable O-glycosylation ligase (exosortase A-associated)
MMVGVPYVQIFALITLFSLLFGKNKKQLKWTADGASIIFILILMHGLLSASLAYTGLARNWELYSNMVKTLLFCFLMPLLATNRLRIHALVLIVALALGFHGVLDGLKFIASAGTHTTSGIPKFGDNNHFALVLVMVLPLLLYFRKYSENRLVSFGFSAGFLLVSLAVISTNSRGGLLGLITVAFFLVIHTKKKVAGILGIFLVASIMLALAPDNWTDRMNTIKSAEQDSSFLGRVAAWKRASAIAVQNPVFGGGYHAGQAPSIFGDFRDKQGILGFVDTPPQNYPAATHSIYFEVLGDLGFVGLFIFLACFVNSYLSFKKIQSCVREKPVELAWATDLSVALMASILAYLVCGAALSAAYFEMPYIMVMLMEVLKQQVVRDTGPSLRKVAWA